MSSQVDAFLASKDDLTLEEMADGMFGRTPLGIVGALTKILRENGWRPAGIRRNGEIVSGWVRAPGKIPRMRPENGSRLKDLPAPADDFLLPKLIAGVERLPRAFSTDLLRILEITRPRRSDLIRIANMMRWLKWESVVVWDTEQQRSVRQWVRVVGREPTPPKGDEATL